MNMKKSRDKKPPLWAIPSSYAVGLEKIKAFQEASSANRRCADCGEIPASNVVLTLGTFICNSCAVIHLELANKCVNVSLFDWTSEKADEIIFKGGNQVNNNKYPSLAPSGKDLKDLRDIIHTKYSTVNLPSNGPQPSEEDDSFCIHDPFTTSVVKEQYLLPTEANTAKTKPRSTPAVSKLLDFLD